MLLVNKRLDWLQALRGVCAIAVVIGHGIWPLTTASSQVLSPLIGEDAASKIPVLDQKFFFIAWNLVSPSLLYVGAFFIVSGFVIPLTLVKGSKSFFLGRLFRIFPPLWVALLIAFITSKYVFQINHSDSAWISAFFLFGDSSVLSPIWSLVIEVRFYILIGIWFVFFKEYKILSIAMSTLGVFSFAILQFVENSYFYLSLSYTLFHFQFIAIGIAFRLIWEKADLRSILVLIFGIVSLKVSFISSQIYPHPWLTYLPESALFGAVTLFGLFLILAKLQLKCPKSLSFLGEISYSLYLCHIPVIYFSYWCFIKSDFLFRHFYLAPFIGIAAAIFIASILNWAVEQRAISLGKLLVRKSA